MPPGRGSGGLPWGPDRLCRKRKPGRGDPDPALGNAFEITSELVMFTIAIDRSRIIKMRNNTDPGEGSACLACATHHTGPVTENDDGHAGESQKRRRRYDQNTGRYHPLAGNLQGRS